MTITTSTQHGTSTDAPAERVNRRGARPIPEPLRVALAELLADPRTACRGNAPSHDAEIHGEHAPAREARHAAAIATCHTCPVITTCAIVAIRLGRDAHGVWAGIVRG